jgi:hypothetical protein
MTRGTSISEPFRDGTIMGRGIGTATEGDSVQMSLGLMYDQGYRSGFESGRITERAAHQKVHYEYGTKRYELGLRQGEREGERKTRERITCEVLRAIGQPHEECAWCRDPEPNGCCDDD